MNDITQIHKIVFLLTLLLLFLCLEEASGWPGSRKGDVVAVPDAREDLHPALREMEDQKWDRAMVGFWTFMQDKEGHEEGYSLAHLGMARAAYTLGHKQLATESYAEIVLSNSSTTRHRWISGTASPPAHIINMDRSPGSACSTGRY